MSAAQWQQDQAEGERALRRMRAEDAEWDEIRARVRLARVAWAKFQSLEPGSERNAAYEVFLKANENARLDVDAMCRRPA